MLSKLKYILPIVLGIALTTAAAQASYLFPYQGGTGTSTVPAYGQVLVGTASGLYNLAATSTLGITAGAGGTFGSLQWNSNGSMAGISTTTASCSGSASCTTFTIIGSSPVTISATGGSTFGYPFIGNATSTTLTFSGGLVSQGSTTISGLPSGLVGNNNGLLYGFSSTSLFGYIPLNPTRNISTTYPLGGGGNLGADLTLTFSGVGTSTPWTPGNVVYVGNNNTLTSIATTTHTYSGPFTVSGSTGFLVGGTNSTVTYTGLATTSQPASSNLLVSNGGAGVYGVGTSSISVSSGLTTTGTLGAQVGGAALTLKQLENRSFSYATTSWTGTTTIPLGIGYGEVWNSMKCFTDVGTLNVDFYHASTHFQFFNASTTAGTVNMGASTDTVGDKVKVDIGTPASSPTVISCTLNNTI